VTEPDASSPALSSAPTTDPVLDAIDGLLTVARDNMAAWMGVMERAELIRSARRRGVAYTTMQLDSPTAPIIDAVSRNQERLTIAAAQLRRTLARALVEEGMSHAEIARLFGVSRQRVGILLRNGHATGVDGDPADWGVGESDTPGERAGDGAESAPEEGKETLP
jgi:hypothetical protein